MAITTVAGLRTGMLPLYRWTKTGNTRAPSVPGIYQTSWYNSPNAGDSSVAGLNGEALVAPVIGQLPFLNPASGNSYLTRFSATPSLRATYLLCDKLWRNETAEPNLSNGTTTIAAPVAIPARDRNGSTNGVGVQAGIEIAQASSNDGGVTLTLSYTNSSGVGGRTASLTSGASPHQVGDFYSWPLQEGDLGVRQVDSVTFVGNWTSGTTIANIVLYRVLASVGCEQNVEGVVDYLSGGFVRLYDDTVPFILRDSSVVTAATSAGTFGIAQG